jgi:hypothetical protein
MPEDFAQITDGTGTKIRTRQRTIGANVVEEQYVIVQPEAVPANRVWVSTLRIPTRALNASATQPLFSIYNGIAAGGNLVSLRRLTVEMDTATAYAGQSPLLRLFRTTAAPGSTTGTLLTPQQQYTADAAFSTSVVVRADHQGDNVVATTALTQGSLAASPMWSQTVPRMHTASGFYVPTEFNLLPNDSVLMQQDPLIMMPGQGCHVQFINGGVATTTTGTWFTFMFKAVLAEFIYP